MVWCGFEDDFCGTIIVVEGEEEEEEIRVQVHYIIDIWANIVGGAVAIEIHCDYCDRPTEDDLQYNCCNEVEDRGGGGVLVGYCSSNGRL